MKLLLVVGLIAMVAQVLPSCEGEPREIVGWVEEKYDRTPSGQPGRRYIIVINHVEYEVPYAFWTRVGKGDLVKYDGNQWTIVKKASEYQSWHGTRRAVVSTEPVASLGVIAPTHRQRAG